jgi:(1->4)-alpha-D-glucan 1-alpha-D-glucosylmutase
MFLTQRLLQFRNEHVDLFRSGNYLPIQASGAFADCCVSFARQWENQWVVVVAPRLSSRIGFPPIGEKWKDTIVDLSVAGVADPGKAHDLFTGREICVKNRQVKLSDALSILPFAALTKI